MNNKIRIGDLIGVISMHSYPKVIREAIVEHIDGSLLYLSDGTTEQNWDVKLIKRNMAGTIVSI
jgi:hypothetical protein